MGGAEECALVEGDDPEVWVAVEEEEEGGMAQSEPGRLGLGLQILKTRRSHHEVEDDSSRTQGHGGHAQVRVRLACGHASLPSLSSSCYATANSPQLTHGPHVVGLYGVSQDVALRVEAEEHAPEVPRLATRG